MASSKMNFLLFEKTENKACLACYMKPKIINSVYVFKRRVHAIVFSERVDDSGTTEPTRFQYF